MLPDIHMHTSFSTDSDTPVEKMAEAAIAKGMDTICITDHHDQDLPYKGFRINPQHYWRKLSEVREMYRGRIRILIGVEMGMQKHLHDDFLEFVNAYPYDYVIGSMHMVAGIDPYYRAEFQGSDEELYRRYFEETLECVSLMEGIQSLGHLDYVVRYGWERERSYDLLNYMDIIDKILRVLIRRGIALEVNTGGLKSGIGFPNPHPDILRRYRELGGELITLGADAHSPEYIGYGFDRAVELIKAAGFNQISLFVDKKAEHIVI